MKKLLLLLFISTFMNVMAQDPKFVKPDYDKIEKEIQDKKSDYYYSKLEDKYQKGDSTMTIEEKRHFYYGFTFQKKYASSYISKAKDSLLSIIRKEELTDSDCAKIISYGDTALNENPTDIRVINYQLYALERQGKMDKLAIRIAQLRVLVDAILSSGEGTSKKNAFYVINVPHEYDILNILGFKFGGSQSLIETYDYLKVEQNEYNIEGFYFEISPSLNYFSKKLKQ